MRNGSFLPTAWNRKSVLGDFFNDFDRIFASVPDVRNELSSGLSKVGAVDIVEGDKAYYLHVDVPGFTKDQIKVEVNADRLTIRAEKDEESDKSEKTYHLRERHHASFERSFNLDGRAAGDAIKAKYENGVLTLEIPKRESAQQKTITIS